MSDKIKCMFHPECVAQPRCWMHLHCLRRVLTPEERAAQDERIKQAVVEVAPEIARLLLKAATR